MTFLKRNSSFAEIDLQFDNYGIQVTDKISDLIKDLFEDNPDIVLSYKGVKLSMGNEGVEFEKDDTTGFIIHTNLSEPDMDNFKIHGFSVNNINDSCVISDAVEENEFIDSRFNKTNLFW